MATEQHIESQLDGGEAAQVGMPAGVRRVVFCVLGVLLALAAYLIAVRGEALLVDIQAFGTRVWCW
jgi:hypothetical protein